MLEMDLNMVLSSANDNTILILSEFDRALKVVQIKLAEKVQMLSDTKKIVFIGSFECAKNFAFPILVWN